MVGSGTQLSPNQKFQKRVSAIVVLLCSLVLLIGVFSGAAAAELPTQDIGQGLSSNHALIGLDDDTTDEVQGEILVFWVEKGEFSPGDTIEGEARVENTGDSTHEFFVGFDVKGPNGNYYNNNGNTGTSVRLDPGEARYVSLSWTVEEEAPAGSYDAITALWEESNPDNLYTKLASRTENYAFAVSKPTKIKGYVTDSNGDSLAAKVYLDSVTDTRTDSNGYYSFSNVEPGDHEVYVTAGGCYNTPTKSVSVESGQTKNVDVTLSSQSYTVQLDSEPISVNTDGEGTYNCGKDIDVSAPASSGDYEFSHWEARDGSLWAEEASFTISYITQNHDLVAQYQQAGKPDLTITNINWDPSNPADEDGVSFEVDIKNQGEARASSFDLELTVENDVLRATDLDLGPGDSGTVTLPTWEAVEGTYDISSEVDYEERIDEEDESNNDYSTAISVESSEVELSASAEYGGSIDIYPPGVSIASGYTNTYEEGTQVDLTANPGSGYKFTGWNGDISSTKANDKSITVKMDQMRSIKATFQKESAEYELSVNSDYGGGLEIYPPGLTTSSGYTDTYEEGTQVDLTATTNSGYQFTGWEGDVSDAQSGDKSISVKMDQTRSIRATFQEQTSEVKLSASAEYGGEIEINPPGESIASGYTATYEEGTRVDLTANPSSGFKFTGWKGDLQSSKADDESIAVTMDKARSIRASFEEEKTQYELSVDSEAGGDLEIYPPGLSTESEFTNTYEEGTTVDLYATAKPGYKFGGWEGDVSSSKVDDTSITLRMGQTRSVVANFYEERPKASIVGLVVGKDVYRPGGVVQGTVTVKNTGEVSHEYWVDISARGPSTGWLTGEGKTVEINPGEQKTIRLSWAISEDVQTGSYDIGAAIYRSETKDTDERFDSVTLTSKVDIKSRDREAKIIDFNGPSGDHRPGETVTTEITVKNTGNIEHTFHVKNLYQGPEGLVYDSEDGMQQNVRLAPNEESTLSLSWTIPDSAPEGLFDATAAIWKQESDGSKADEVDSKSKTHAFSVKKNTASGDLQINVQSKSGDAVQEDLSVRLLGPVRKSKRTSSMGVVTYQDIPSGEYTVIVSDHEVIGTPFKEIDFNGGSQIKSIDVELSGTQEQASISGKVVIENGEPLANVRVQAEDEGISVTTDEEGNFEFDQSFDAWEDENLKVYVDGQLYRWKKVTPSEGENSYTLEVDNYAAVGKRDISHFEWKQHLGAYWKASIMNGVNPSPPDTPFEMSGNDLDDVCEDTHSTAKTECLIQSQELSHQRSIYAVGSIYGITHGLAETAEALSVQNLMKVAHIASNLGHYMFKTLEVAVYLSTNPQALEEIARQVPEQVNKAQQDDNIFPEGTEEYRTFKEAWYGGLVTYHATGLVSTSGASAVLKGSLKGTKAAEVVDDAASLVKSEVGQSKITRRILRKTDKDDTSGSVPDPTEIPTYKWVIADAGDAGENFKDKLSDKQLSTFLKMDSKKGIDSDMMEDFVSNHGEAGAIFVKESLERGDSDLITSMLRMESDTNLDGVKWKKWRSELLEKYRVSKANSDLDGKPIGPDHDNYKTYLETSRKAAKNEKIEGAKSFFRGDQIGEDVSGFLSRKSGEGKIALRKADEDDVDLVIVEPEFGADSKDVDIRISRVNAEEEFIEVKTLGKATSKPLDGPDAEEVLTRRIESNLLSDSNAVTKKFSDDKVLEEISESDTKVASFNIPTSKELNEQEVRNIMEKVLESNGNDLNIDELRLYVDGESKTVWEIGDGTVSSPTDSIRGITVQQQTYKASALG